MQIDGAQKKRELTGLKMFKAHFKCFIFQQPWNVALPYTDLSRLFPKWRFKKDHGKHSLFVFSISAFKPLRITPIELP